MFFYEFISVDLHSVATLGVYWLQNGFFSLVNVFLAVMSDIFQHKCNNLTLKCLLYHAAFSLRLPASPVCLELSVQFSLLQQ